MDADADDVAAATADDAADGVEDTASNDAIALVVA
jgi:hypothetical protein